MVYTYAEEDWSAAEDPDSQSEVYVGWQGPYIRNWGENANQMKPDLEEVFSNGSQVGSVNERDHLKSLSIITDLPKAY